MTFDDSRIWGFYVEARRETYVYIFDFEVSPGRDHITPIGELYRVPLARFTAPPDFEPCDLYHALFETTAPEAIF
jgi:hypothetical protein